ncbi:MAG: hypothetical protein ACREDK_04325 [Thermoplasmata archaeon]
MIEGAAYDGTLTQRLRDERATFGPPTDAALEAWKALVERAETRLRTLLSGHDLDRALVLLRPPSTGALPPESRTSPVRVTHPAVRVLDDLLAWSEQLDRTAEPVHGLTIGEQVARWAHSAARALNDVLRALDPVDAAARSVRRVLDLASELVHNALARIREFARHLGVTSTSITFASTPPELSITFTFGAP